MKEIKIYAYERTEAIDYSPIYTLIIGQDVEIRKGDILRFDPASKSLTIGIETNNA